MNRQGVSKAGWVSTVICLLLQAMVAPYISIAGATPLFLVIPVLIIASEAGMSASVVFAFLLGLLYDLGSGGPLGAMSFSLSLVAAGCCFVPAADSRGMSPVAVVLYVFLVELIEGIFMAVTGQVSSLGAIFAPRILLGTVYSSAFTLFGFWLARYFAGRKLRRQVGLGSRLGSGLR